MLKNLSSITKKPTTILLMTAKNANHDGEDFDAMSIKTPTQILDTKTSILKD